MKHNNSKTALIGEFAAIIADEYERQINLIECDDKSLLEWISSSIKDKLLTKEPTLTGVDAWMTGYDILEDTIIYYSSETDRPFGEKEWGDGEEWEEYAFSFLNENENEIFEEAERIINGISNESSN